MVRGAVEPLAQSMQAELQRHCSSSVCDMQSYDIRAEDKILCDQGTPSAV